MLYLEYGVGLFGPARAGTGPRFQHARALVDLGAAMLARLLAVLGAAHGGAEIDQSVGVLEAGPGAAENLDRLAQDLDPVRTAGKRALDSQGETDTARRGSGSARPLRRRRRRSHRRWGDRVEMPPTEDGA